MFETEKELTAYAKGCNDNDDGRLPFCEIGWAYEDSFPVSRLLEIMPSDKWKEWLAEEIDMLDQEYGDGKRWRCLTEEHIEEPVVMLDHGGLTIWDGWHRSAAAVAKGASTLRAVIGTKRDLSEVPASPAP